jgi:hypothetical protein
MARLPYEKPVLFKGRHFNHLLIIQAVRWNNHALPVFTFDGGLRWITFLQIYWK